MRALRAGGSFHVGILDECVCLCTFSTICHTHYCYIVLVRFLLLCQASTQSDRQKFAVASLGALYQLVIQGAQALRGDVAFPELFGPLQSVTLKVSRVFSWLAFGNRFTGIF